MFNQKARWCPFLDPDLTLLKSDICVCLRWVTKLGLLIIIASFLQESSYSSMVSKHYCKVSGYLCLVHYSAMNLIMKLADPGNQILMLRSIVTSRGQHEVEMEHAHVMLETRSYTTYISEQFARFSKMYADNEWTLEKECNIRTG